MVHACGVSVGWPKTPVYRKCILYHSADASPTMPNYEVKTREDRLDTGKKSSTHD